MPSDDILALDVRSQDYDRFLCIQLAPPARRPALYALTAFSIELARIAETVSEPLLGHVRLAWWREALEELAANAVPRNHPVVRALAALLGQVPTLLPLLLAMVEARAGDLDESLLAEEDAWLAYLDGTAGALHRAWALVLNAQAAEMHHARITQSARGYAMIGLARAIPYMAAQGFLRFPRARLATHHISALAPSPELTTMVKSLVKEGDMLLTRGRLPRTLQPLDALAQLANQRATSLQRANYAVFNQRSTNLAAIMRLLKMKFFLW